MKKEIKKKKKEKSEIKMKKNKNKWKQKWKNNFMSKHTNTQHDFHEVLEVNI
jgi:uncharacterized protein YjlB